MDSKSLKDLTVQAGITFVLADDAESELKHSNTIAYYNPGDVLEDKRFRSIAIGNRVITFTQKESLAAFLIALSSQRNNVSTLSKNGTKN